MKRPHYILLLLIFAVIAYLLRKPHSQPQLQPSIPAALNHQADAATSPTPTTQQTKRLVRSRRAFRLLAPYWRY